MASIFRRFRGGKKQDDVLEKLEPRKLDSLFRRYYLNNEKIDEFFEQAYGDLTEYTRTHAKEIAAQTGGSIKSSQALTLLTGLEAQLKADLQRKKGETRTEKYQLGAIVRFNILREYWTGTNSLHALDKANREMLSKPQTLIFYRGKYRLVNSVADLIDIEQERARIIERQQRAEEDLDRESRSLYLIKFPALAVAILLRRLISNAGTTYLPHFSDKESNILFIGATVGYEQDILFLDPIAIGEEIAFGESNLY